MATTWFKSLHINKGKSIARTIMERTKYTQNPYKTNDGEYVSAYACDLRTVDEEFMLAKKEYAFVTGRDQGARNVLAYHIRQAFKPGEIEPETANRIGYELAMSFTKGKHAFIVCTHVDRHHIHSHIIFNSTTLSCDRKFNDFKQSGMAIRRLSDLLCLENGLSVIENTKVSNGKSYGDWLGGKEPSWQERIRNKIDEVLPDCASFSDFLSVLKADGYLVKDSRKYISITAPVRSGHGG